jgi:O-antigen/teichoic acid export membrane protein
MNFTERVSHGLSWSLASRICTQGFQFVFGIALARLLTPNDFGIVGMLFVITGFALALGDAGLSSALIYDQQATEVHFSTVFWLQLGTGACLSAIFFGAGSYIADFYELPTIGPLSRFISFTFVIQALGQTHSAMLSKHLRFKQLAVVNIASTLFSGVIAVGLAWFGYGVWSLAWQGLLSPTIVTILLWIQSGWRPRLTFDPRAAAVLGRYGLYLLGHTSINYWLRNGDKLVIGKLLGAHDLGIYARAYSLMLLPLNNIGAVLGQVMFPALAQLQNDLPRFRSSYLSAIQVIALVVFPLMMGLAALCEPFVLFLLGPRWSEVTPILQILSFVGLLQSIVFPVGWIFTALGKTKEQFHLSIYLAFAFVLTIAFGIQFGIKGVAYAYALWTLLSAWLNLRLAGSFIDLSLQEVLKTLSAPFCMTSLMGAVVFGVDHELLRELSSVFRIICGSVVGIALYLGLCILTKDRAFATLTRFISARMRIG